MIGFTYSQTINNSQNQTKMLLPEKEEEMKGITLRKDNRYMIRRTINGQRVTEYAKTKEEAKKILSKLKRTNLIIKKPHKLYTLKQWLNEWLENYKKPFVRQQTYHDIKMLMNKICNELGNEYLDNLTTNRIQTYLNKEQKSRKKELLVLYFESAIKKALELDITKNNFIKGIIKDKKIKNKRFAFNYFEQEQILQELENYPNIKMAIYFYLLTGARKNELIKNSKDIDLQNNFITIRGTKTEKSKLRVIECASEFLQQLQNYMNNNKFPTTAYIAKIFNKLCKSININNGTLHRLRHTFATNCYVLGIKDKQIQEWLGHESIETTMNIYTDLDKTLTKEKIITLYKNMYYLPND